MTKLAIYKILMQSDFTGATLNQDGPVNYESGYQVSIQDLVVFSVKSPLHPMIDYIQFVINAYSNDKVSIGLWLDNDKIYVDVSSYFDDLDEAIQVATTNSQKAIFNWSTKESEAVK